MVIEWISKEGDDSHDRSKTLRTARASCSPALVLILGAYWAGARYGLHEPTKLRLLPSGGSLTASAQRDASFD